jgi:Ca2+-binding RTX toxin-like protein
MANILGTPNNDILDGTQQDDILLGRHGNDSLNGGNGNDTLQGDDGHDTLIGGRGNDLLDGGNGNDSLQGDSGHDTLIGGRGNDLLDGGNDSDTLRGGDDRDTLIGGRGNDLLDGGNGNDSLRGGDDRDTLIGGRGNDLLDGGNNSDNLQGDDGDDTLIGGRDSDTLNGGNGNDILIGDGSSRLFALTDKNSLVSFDPDRPDQATSIQVTGISGNLIGIDLRPANGLLYGVTDTNNIYTINVNTGAATLVSSIAPIPFNAGQLSGVDFNPIPDRLRLVGSNDQNLRVNVDNGLVVDGNNNPADGIQPDGTLAYAANDFNAGVDPNITAAAYTNSLAPSPRSGRTTLYNIDSNLDTLVTQGSPNFLMGDPNTPVSPNSGQLFTVGSLGVDFGATAGFDIFSLANPANPNNSVNLAYAVTGSTLYGINLSTGTATNLGTIGNGSFNFIGLSATASLTVSGNDILIGGSGNDTLIGGRGSDLLDGGTGNDNLQGGDDRDTLLGGSGDDLLDGGNGNDNLQGGDGNDTLIGGRDKDLLDGGNGNDSLQGGDNPDTLIGGRGNDILNGGRERDNLDGGDGDDTLIGGRDSDTLNGGNGNDILIGDGSSRLFALTDKNSLVSFDPDRPDQATSIQVTGISGNLIGIDLRPANGLLYGVTDTNNIYTINVNTGAATLVSSIAPIPFNAGQLSGVDFNPIPDRLRLVGSNDQNLRVNVDNGLVVDGNNNPADGIQPDGTLAYAANDFNAGVDPNITAAAYTNSLAPSPRSGRTTLYNIDSNLDTLVTQGSPNFLMGDPNTPVSPNSGQLFTVGSLGVDFGATAGFDIFSLANPANPNNSVNLAYAVTGSTLYGINLSTGTATNLGTIGNGTFNFVGLSAITDLTGSNDILTGGSGNDTLIGGRGNDTLTGGAGADSFSFGSRTEGIDIITDFSVADDTVFVSAAGFGGGLVAGASITIDQFVIGASAVDAADRFIYNSANGALSFDVDGAGGAAQVQIASLSTGLALTNNDIFVAA